MRLTRMINEEKKLKEQEDGITRSSVSREDLYNIVDGMLSKGMAPSDVSFQVVKKYETDVEEIAIVMGDDGYDLEDFRFDVDDVEEE